MIYLDHHSTTPLDPAVFEAMKPYFFEKFGNASHGVHRMNWEAESAVEHARTQVATLIGAHEKEIIFTSGATESNQMAILGISTQLESLQRRKILSIAIEHSSVLGALEQMKDRGFEVDFVKIGRDGRVDLDHLQACLNSSPGVHSSVGLVSIAYANHEIGTIQDIAAISKLVHAAGAFLHVDAVQAAGKIAINVNTDGIDLLTLSAHKIYGPKGIGALYVRRKNPRVELEPIFWGGSQERGLRPGTPNVPAIVGFGKAAEIALEKLATEPVRIAALRNLLLQKLQSGLQSEAGLTPVGVESLLVRNGSIQHALPNNLNISIRGIDGSALYSRLKAVAVSNASACISGVQDYSQVLSELGVSPALAKATLRFGVGRFNTENEIESAAGEVVAVVKDLLKIERDFAAQTGETE
jgi:cysteine desulfurase